jgi:VanZ family protein
MKINELWNGVKPWLPAIVIMGAIFIFSSFPSAELPDFGKIDLSVKKLGHIIGYALLARSFLHAFGPDRPRSVWLAWMLAVLYGFSDEFHQSFVPGRGSRLSDVGIDAAGAFLGLLPVILRKYQKQKRKLVSE